MDFKPGDEISPTVCRDEFETGCFGPDHVFHNGEYDLGHVLEWEWFNEKIIGRTLL